MGKSSLVLLCCAQLIFSNMAYAEKPEGRANIYEEKINFQTVDEQSLGKEPIAVLASSADMTVQINLPPASDLQSTDRNITYDNNGIRSTINLDHFNEKIFSLAYSVFVMNDKIAYAFKVADAAVAHNPKNIIWRKKLAKVALWSGNAEVALDQWMYFINNNIDPEEYLDEALRLAKQLFNYDAQVTILHYNLEKFPNNKELLLLYNEAVQNQGFPFKALKMLQTIPDSEQDLQYLKQFIGIAKGVDNPILQLHYLEHLNKLDKKDIDSKIEQAEVLYSQGKFADAYTIEESVAAEVAPDNIKFWSNYGGVSLLSGNYHSTITAFKHLLSASKLSKPLISQLVDLERLDGKIDDAYKDANIGYKQYPSIELVKSILRLGTDLEKWAESKHFLETLSVQNLKEIDESPEDSVLVPIINRHLGLVVEAYQGWEKVLSRWPNLSSLQQSYLWELIDNNEIKQLEYIVKTWCTIFNLKPELWEPYASALVMIGDYPEALRVMEQHQDQVNTNYTALLSISDLFTENNNDYSAYYLKRRALYLVLKEIGKNPNNLLLNQSLALAESLRAFAPASITYNYLVNLSSKLFTQSEIDEEIMAYALEESNYDLASYIVQIHDTTGAYTKPWIKMTLALEENDRDLMLTLLADSPKLLPYRDRVRAAERTGNMTLAEEYAYQGLEEHPEDAEMYDLFTETLLPRTNEFSAEAAQQGWGNVSGPLTKLSGRVYISPSISISPFAEAWFPHSYETSIIATAPSVDETAGIKVRRDIERGWVEVSVAERHGLGQTAPLKFKWHRDSNFTSKLNTEVDIGYHIQADETTPLLLGGMKNEIKLELDYFTDSYNHFDTELSFDQFLGQDGFHLGTGQELRGHWQHKFYLSYPDWNVNLYGSWLNYQYKSNQTVSPFLQKLIPVDQDPLTSFYMPVNDIDAAITFGFGQEYREKYSRRWRPFLETGIVYSKVFGFGPTAQGGITGSIFGRDRLVLFGEYTVNQQQTNPQPVNQQQPQESQVYYIIGIRYDYFF